MKSLKLLKAEIWHRRDKPSHNEFTHRVFYVSHDLREERENVPRFFSFDRSNVMSIKQKNHGVRDGSDLLSWVKKSFIGVGVVPLENDSIEFIAHPSVFGYTFNPISFYNLLGTKGELKAVLCEVHNTFNDDHSYVLAHKDLRPIIKSDVFTAEKALYVSPFNTMNGSYTFSFEKTAEGFCADIVYWKDGEWVIKTAVAGKYSPCTSLSIIVTYVTYPLMTLMVVFRIHWQAVRLYFKKVPHTLKEKPLDERKGVTRGFIQS